MKLLAAIFAAALVVASASADTLRLKNGSSVEGTFLGGNSRQVEFLNSNGSVKKYSVSDVTGISFGEVAADEPAVAAETAVAAPRAPRRTRAGFSRASSSATNVIPAGTVVSIRMIDSIDSDITGVGERFRASLAEALIVDGREIAPRGADAFVEVAKVETAGKVRGRAEIAVELVSLTVDGREYEIDSNYAEVQGDSKTKKTATRAGIGALAGGIIGAIAGGGKGALIGAGVGGGAGTVYSATKGENVRIPSETLLTFSLRKDLHL